LALEGLPDDQFSWHENFTRHDHNAMSKKIMILDDDPDILQICTIILRRKGYEVISLDSSLHVTEEAKQHLPDAILMDNRIPGPGGVEATRLLKRDPDLRHIPIIFFSASSNTVELARDAKADYLLQKPFDIGDLEAIVHLAVSGNVAI